MHAPFDSSPAQQPRGGFTLVELLVVIAIIGILVGLLLPAVQAAREAARRAQCQSNMKNVALAVLNYESTHKSLPVGMTFDPAAASNISYGSSSFELGKNWIIEVLPFMESQAIYDAFDFSTRLDNNDPNSANYLARGAEISVLLCPTDEFNTTKFSAPRGTWRLGDNWGRGNYAANAGRGDIWPNRNTGPGSPHWDDDCKRGVIGPNAGVPLRRVTDGTTKTIMIGEVRVGPSPGDARGVWALGHAGASLVAGYGSGGDDNGPNACAPTTSKPDDIVSDICDQPFAIETCMSCDSGYFAQATVRSSHVGGAFIAMCDGSVTFASDDLETSGDFGQCCTPWDYMIASADSESPGPYNSASGGRRSGCN